MQSEYVQDVVLEYRELLPQNNGQTLRSVAGGSAPVLPSQKRRKRDAQMDVRPSETRVFPRPSATLLWG